MPTTRSKSKATESSKGPKKHELPLPFFQNVAVVCLLLFLLQSTLLRISAMYDWHMYNSMHVMQLTIFTMHLTPIFCLRSLIPIFMVSRKDLSVHIIIVAYVLMALNNRMSVSDPVSPYNLVLFSLETASALLPALSTPELLSEYLLPMFALVNPVIVVGFWGGICAAACSSTFSFMPVDRHIRAAFLSGAPIQYFSDPEAAHLLRREVVGHFLMQALAYLCCTLLVHVLRRDNRLFSRLPVSGKAVRTLALYVSMYVLITLASSVGLSENGRLPYGLNELLSQRLGIGK
ncbi:hypothetical protein TeGR_g1416 [Tetraparma gracilis]|uniref:Uncharacterized protein n=1 Tax=Tetraparma gracilis TaxID=2962635 RepID=A0ABQ6MLW5_9STRA|nr:hypothetical protein TeGR_g1416 [Tetraparma gracilis]